MKRNILLSLVLIIVLSAEVFSQVRLSLKASPLLASNRVEFTSDTITLSKGGLLPKIALGLIVDKELTETYSFSSGLVYMPKGFTVEVGGSGEYPNPQEEYRLQYLQVPLTFKLFTNEIQPDFKIYFQVGAGLEFLLHDEPIDESFQLVEKFNKFDASVILGAGTEYKLGVSTILYSGITYYRGLLDIVNETVPLNQELIARNTVVSLDLGIKF